LLIASHRVPGNLTYEVECTLDPDIVADYDAWLPGHVRDVLACAGFLGATIETPETAAGERQKRLIRYRLESAGALDQYLENNATRLRTETAQRFGGRVHCVRRLVKPRHDLMPASRELPLCRNCGAQVTGKHCAACGQAVDAHLLSMREVMGDIAHSLLHLDSRVWRTLRLLVLKPGELTREFIAGRHQSYLPPFRLYLAISILFFALSALLPDPPGSGMNIRSESEIPEELRKELAAEGVDTSIVGEMTSREGSCQGQITDNPSFKELNEALNRACISMHADGGKRFLEHFAANAPKLMFLFLPLMAGVALLFYWRPRRLYAEHLVLFLQNHAFTFALLAVTQALAAIKSVADLLYLYLPYYVYRSMRVVYAEGRLKTTLKFLALSTIYFLLLGITMLGGLLYTILRLS
jgi:hypothetical protein